MHPFPVPLSEKISLLRKALAKRNLLAYMIGDKGYEYVCPYADVPTYHEEVFDSIIGYVTESKDYNVWNNFISCLLKISVDPTYSWFALYYVSAYARYFDKKENIPVPLDDFLSKIVANIQANKSALCKDQRWMGRGFTDGLWDNAIRMAAILKRDLGLDIILK